MQSKGDAAPVRRGKRPVTFAQRFDDLCRQRDQRVAQIRTLRRSILSNKFLDDAWHLLAGRRWSRGDTRSREQLLRTVDWLIVLALRSEKLAGAADVASKANAPLRVRKISG